MSFEDETYAPAPGGSAFVQPGTVELPQPGTKAPPGDVVSRCARDGCSWRSQSLPLDEARRAFRDHEAEHADGAPLVRRGRRGKTPIPPARIEKLLALVRDGVAPYRAGPEAGISKSHARRLVREARERGELPAAPGALPNQARPT